MRELPLEGNALKLNIFRTDLDSTPSIVKSLHKSGMNLIAEFPSGDWTCNLYYGDGAGGAPVGWLAGLATLFPRDLVPVNQIHFATILATKNDQAFAITYGKSHFYIRPWADFDFGIEMAKRVADELDIRQTAARRFSGKERKSIRTFSSESRLAVESGESVDLIQGSIRKEYQSVFGSSGKFGNSMQFQSGDKIEDIGKLLDNLCSISSSDPLFKLPHTVVVTDDEEIAALDNRLVEELRTERGTTEFVENGFDLYGVDFTFSSTGHYEIQSGHFKAREVEALHVGVLKDYIDEKKLSDKGVLRTRVKFLRDDSPPYSQPLKEVVDFIVDDENVALSNGKWMRFNQDYLSYLNEEIRSIRVEPTEEPFLEINLPEGEFNASEPVLAAGYQLADKDFSKIQVEAKTPVEAWDLQRGEVVYAVKFGTAQKLGYVCDQAINVLELMRNRATVAAVPNFRSYCLWLGYRGQKLPASIADSGSIILKQKIELWARKCRNMGVEPVIKLSRRSMD